MNLYRKRNNPKWSLGRFVDPEALRYLAPSRYHQGVDFQRLDMERQLRDWPVCQDAHAIRSNTMEYMNPFFARLHS